MVKSNRYDSLYSINCQAYRFLEYFIKKRYSAIPEITSIYIAHGLALGELYPGLSDFDIAIIFETSELLTFYDKLRIPLEIFKRFIPARDLLLFTKREFDLWQRFGGGWEPLDELKHWKCIYGVDLRHSNLNLTELQAEKDRLLYAFTKYQSLLYSVIKEKLETPYLAISDRRSLYKAFCSSILSLDGKYLSIGNQFQRLSKWVEENGDKNSSIIQDLLKMHKNRFHKGEISNLKFRIGALSYKIINRALANIKYPTALPLRVVPWREKTFPLSNLPEVRERIKCLISNILDIIKQNLLSLTLVSNGSSFGYKLFVILKDGLLIREIEEVLRAIHVIFRIHDDAWFNEHFPAKVPIVYSKNMFIAHLRLWPFDRNYVHSHRHVLYGEDLYQEFTATQLVTDFEGNFERELLHEEINLSRYIHQLYLEKLKPALYDAVTLLFPRLHIAHKSAWAPSTVEEAVFYYDKFMETKSVNFPKFFFEKFGNKNIDTITRTMPDDAFEMVWKFLTDSFVSKSYEEHLSIREEN